MTRSPDPIDGPDYRVTFQVEPGGLVGAAMASVEGRFTGAALLRAYEVLVAFADGRVLNVIADTRHADTFLDFAAYQATTDLIISRGITRLNLVVCERDTGRQYVVRFGNEVAQLGGLTVRSRIVEDIAAAPDALAGLMAQAG